MQNSSECAPTVWYRQFWPWFLLVLPGLAVVASLFTFALAAQRADTSVRDAFTKTGFAITPEPSAAINARRYQLQGNGEIDLEIGTLGLELQGRQIALPTLLTLVFVHPFDGHEDFAVTLQRDRAGVYRAGLPRAVTGRWTLQLFDPAAQVWQLRGQVDLDRSHQIVLQP